MEKVLVTGAAGYIGSVLTRQLLNKGYFVRGLDILNFGGESLIGIYNNPKFEFIKGDVRKTKDLEKAIDGVDAVVHLAAIVGDPACAKEPEIAKETNWEASQMLFDLCNESTYIKQFIFASTCSNYGKMKGDGFVNEESPLNPVSKAQQRSSSSSTAKTVILFLELVIYTPFFSYIITKILKKSCFY